MSARDVDYSCHSFLKPVETRRDFQTSALGQPYPCFCAVRPARMIAPEPSADVRIMR